MNLRGFLLRLLVVLSSFWGTSVFALNDTHQARTVGLLSYQDANSRVYYCSATAINNNFVITAAHCLFTKDGRLRPEMHFHPGIRAQSSQSFGRFPIVEIYAPESFERDRFILKSEFDIAIFRVANNEHGDDLTRFIGGSGWWGPKELPAPTARIIGYKSVAPPPIQECDIRTFGELALQTFCSNVGEARSLYRGAPVLIKHAASNRSYIIGVYSSNLGPSSIFTRVTPERQKIMNEIVAGTYAQNRAKYQEVWDIERLPRSNNPPAAVNSGHMTESEFKACVDLSVDLDGRQDSIKKRKSVLDLEFGRIKSEEERLTWLKLSMETAKSTYHQCNPQFSNCASAMQRANQLVREYNSRLVRLKKADDEYKNMANRHARDFDASNALSDRYNASCLDKSAPAEYVRKHCGGDAHFTLFCESWR